MTQNIFGANIARYRGKAGLTQAALAERIGVSAQAISKWETGGGYPDVETIPLLARELGTTTDALFGIERNQPENQHFDPEKWKAEIIDAVTDEIEGFLSELQSTVQEAVEEALSDFDGGKGSKGEDKRVLRVLSPDKTKLLCCVGGLRIADPKDVHNCPPDRFTLMVQTGVDSWDALCYFPNMEQAQEALGRIGEAMRRGERELSL